MNKNPPVSQVPMREHNEIHTREQRLHSNDILADELRLRLAMLDVNPTYNKDTFVHKTASFLKWRDAEQERIEKMLAVCDRLPVYSLED